jgi:hypothetical protein
MYLLSAIDIGLDLENKQLSADQLTVVQIKVHAIKQEGLNFL